MHVIQHYNISLYEFKFWEEGAVGLYSGKNGTEILNTSSGQYWTIKLSIL
jgi:hypothetical protein